MLISGGIFIILLFNYYEFEKMFFSLYEKSFYMKMYFYFYDKFNFLFDNVKFYSNSMWNYVDFPNNYYLNSVTNFLYEALIFTVKCMLFVVKFAVVSYNKMTNNYLNGTNANNFNHTLNQTDV